MVCNQSQENKCQGRGKDVAGCRPGSYWDALTPCRSLKDHRQLGVTEREDERGSGSQTGKNGLYLDLEGQRQEATKDG